MLKATAHFVVPSHFFFGGGENLGAPCKRSAPSRCASKRPLERLAQRGLGLGALKQGEDATRLVGRKQGEDAARLGARRRGLAARRAHAVGALILAPRGSVCADSLGSVSQLFQAEDDARRTIRASPFFCRPGLAAARN